jgi:hypothetical protein
MRPRACRGGGDRGRAADRASFHLGIVFLNHGFDALLRIAAGRQKILIRRIHFILVQIELALRQFQFVLYRVLLFYLRLGQILGELGDALLIGVEHLLGFLQAVLDLECLRTQLRRVSFDVAQGGGEGQAPVRGRRRAAPFARRAAPGESSPTVPCAARWRRRSRPPGPRR